ncbi:unnamed protein product, partial [Brassica oleracea]
MRGISIQLLHLCRSLLDIHRSWIFKVDIFKVDPKLFKMYFSLVLVSKEYTSASLRLRDKTTIISPLALVGFAPQPSTSSPLWLVF